MGTSDSTLARASGVSARLALMNPGKSMKFVPTAFTCTLLAATSAGMLLFTGLSLAGFNRLGLDWVERYEETILGAALILVGIVVAFFKS